MGIDHGEPGRTIGQEGMLERSKAFGAKNSFGTNRLKLPDMPARPVKNSTDLNDLEKREKTYFDPVNGQPYTGHYFWVYENGNLAEEGYLKDGLLHGRIKLYNEAGCLMVEAEYRQGVRNGQVTTYYASGNIKALFTLKDGKRHGRFLMWYEKGGKKYVATYNMDVLHGKQVKYFRNGLKCIEMFYLDGREHGHKTVWNENGDVLFTGEFTHGELL